ncbi:MAG: septal ring lytic transglycosylase RlpA family protein [Gammaproteobacteria bacterium]
MISFKSPFAGLILAALLAGCGGGTAVQPTPRPGPAPAFERDGPPPRPVDVSKVPDAVPRAEPRSRYGNPDSYEVFGKRYYVKSSAANYKERGIASWYGQKFHGRRTSSGETYNMYEMTAAHKTLPLPTYVHVRNLQNGRSVVVKVNDRGPFHDNRIIDMSYAAATRLDMLGKGTALVEVTAIDPGKPPQQYASHKVSGSDSKSKAIPVFSSGNSFYIQIGAFSELQNAERLRSRLDSIADRFARIHQMISNGQTIYRVRIGPLSDVNTADRVVAQLADFNIHEHQIVTE